MSENADAVRLVRRAAEAATANERDGLLSRVMRLVGRAEMRRLWRKYGYGSEV